MATEAGLSSQQPQVTREDQGNINTFGRLNNRLKALQEEIRSKKRDVQNLDDAGSELLICDDEHIRYSVGEVFVHFPRDEADARIEQEKKAAEGEIKRLEGEARDVRSTLAELKRVLYGKFKDSINLEDE